MKISAAALTIGFLLNASLLSAQTSVPCTAPVGTTAPTPTISAVAPNLIISWTAVRGAIAYGVARKNPDGTCWNITGQGTTQTSVQEPIPTIGGTYQYQVGVRFSTGAYALSQWASYDVVVAPVILTPPRDITPIVMNDAVPPAYVNVTGTPTLASLTWAPVTGAVSYTADRYLAGVAGAALTTLTPPSFTGTSISNIPYPDAQLYTYRVTAYQLNGHFGQASTDFKAPPPTNPSGLTGSASNQTVTLSWQSVQYASGYLVSGPGISGTQRVNGTTHSFTAPAGTNVYKVGSVFDPGALSTSSSLFPSVTVQVYAPVATCACTKTGNFTEPTFQMVNPATPGGTTGTFSTSAGLIFTVKVTSTSIDITDPSSRNVFSQPLPQAWGVSPTGDHFFTASKPINGFSTVDVYPVKVGPQKWKQVVDASVAADGLWGFSNDGSMFIYRRYVQSRFIVQAYDLLRSTPQTAVLSIDETNALGAFVQTSPCGDRLWFWMFTSLSPITGQGAFYRRTAFPSKTTSLVTTDSDGSTQMPTSSITSPAMNVFVVQLTGHKARPGATSTFSSLQCTP